MNEPEVKDVERKRDANADLALCDGVPAGPYAVEFDVTGAPCEDDERADRGDCPECDSFGACGVGICGHIIKMASALKSDASWQPQHRIDYDHGADPRGGKGEREQFEEAAAIAAFIAMGPEPLRYWIERARAAEDEAAAIRPLYKAMLECAKRKRAWLDQGGAGREGRILYDRFCEAEAGLWARLNANPPAEETAKP